MKRLIFFLFLIPALAHAQSMKLWDGTNTASVRSTGSNPSVNVAIVDGAGNQVTSFGGGTQYTEGDTDATITGTAVLWEDAGNTLKSVSSSSPLPVSGSLTCNAGTNLNTSALATEATLSTLNGKITACNTGAVSGTVTSNAGTGNFGANLTQLSGNAVNTGNGTAGSGTMRVAIASDQTAYTVNAAQSGTWTVQPGNTANTTPWLVSPRPATSGGLSIFRDLNLGTTDVAVKGSAGQLYGWHLFNGAASTRYFKLFDAATGSVSVGTTTPVLTIPIPAGGAANVEFSHGIAFSTAITAACTTGVADADTGAPGANECIGQFFYN